MVSIVLIRYLRVKFIFSILFHFGELLTKFIIFFENTRELKWHTKNMIVWV